MNNKAKQKLIVCTCLVMGLALYSNLPHTLDAPVHPIVESSDPVDYDRLGTKIFAPKKPTKRSNDEALERYLTPYN
ncbi:hypothetical protein [Sphingobacterium tabacisoli]|uniref:Uncharacterized protein n=1 Tax=Sphingobacterium tabacisoli TaxID=2044855 RepID=A0ABW5L6C5_9SPHI|nr:hypothetical protein [Sphingobacterium tabacisoli]